MTPRKVLINKTKDLIREIWIIERGNKCELTGRPGNRLGLFHILTVGAHPRLELYGPNILLANWFPYHHMWHHDFEKAKLVIEPIIIKMLGKNYREDLLMAEAIQPKLSIVEIGAQYDARKKQLEVLR